MKHKLNLLLFLIPLFVLFVLNLVLHQTKTISMLEKRAIKSKPAFTIELFFSGQYSRDYDNYYADHFVFRDLLVEVGSAIKGFRGFIGDNGATLVVQKGNNMTENLTSGEPVTQKMSTVDVKKGHSSLDVLEQRTAATTTVRTPFGQSKSTPTDQGSPTQAPETATAKHSAPPMEATQAPIKDEVAERIHVANVSDTYLVLKDRALLLYKYNFTSAEAYAKAINRLQASIDPKIRMYNLLVPSQIEFLGIDKYKSLSDSQKEAFSQVNKLLKKSITSIDAYSALLNHKAEYIYLRTDHHWSALGAYYSYCEFMKTIGEVPVPLSEYKTEEINGYLGTTYAATLNSSLKKNPDTITLYMPFIPYQYAAYTSSDVAVKRNVVGSALANDGIRDYTVFLGGDFPWGAIKTNNQNKKNILVLKDSFANAFIPFLLPHYEEIYFIDIRYYKTNLLNFFKDKNITDVLLLNGSFVTTYSGIADLLNAKMNN